MLTVKLEKNGKVGRLVGKMNVTVFEAAREMPGRVKWQDRDLLFELTRANIEFLNTRLPGIVWEKELEQRLDTISEMLENESEELKRRLQPKPLPPEAHSFRFKTDPLDHQREGFIFGRKKSYYGLFFEQGLGKTKTSCDIAADKYQNGEIDTLLVMAPNGVHIQWIKDEIPKHLPDWVPRRMVPYRSNRTKTWEQAVEMVFDYHDGLRIFTINQEAIITANGEAFLRRVLSSGRTMWIIDESPSIQTPGSKRTKIALKYRHLAIVRSILTGTPIGTGIENLYSQLMFLDEDVLGYRSFYSFRNHYCVTRQVPGAPSGVSQIVSYKNIPDLQKRMNAYCIRRTAAECLDLPERIYIERDVELTPEQRRMHDQLLEDMVTQVETGEIVSVQQAVVKLIRLQQIVCGYVQDEEGQLHVLPNNRPKVARAFYEETGGKMVLWARFHHDIDLLKEEFKDLNPAVWDGRCSLDQKLEAKRAFMEDQKCGMFIGNQAAAGTGLDGLQRVSHRMLYYSNNFNSRDRLQSEARLHRMGQAGTVVVGDIVARKTIDTKLLKLLRFRKDLADEALDPNFIKSLRFDDDGLLQ